MAEAMVAEVMAEEMLVAAIEVDLGRCRIPQQIAASVKPQLQ